MAAGMIGGLWCGAGRQDDDDAGALAAVGCLRAISTIMESISTLPHMYPQIEQMCMPIMVKMLSADEQDVYEEVLEMVRRTDPLLAIR